MLRITAGEFRGRLIKVPSSPRVRPTGARAREAIFNILGEQVAGARVLDLFAGSGLLGFEALSRGAASVTFVDSWAGSLAAISATAAGLGVTERTRGLKSTWDGALRRLQEEAAVFDLILADPPYAFFAEGREGEKLLDAIWACAILLPGGIVMLEHPSGAAIASPPADWEGAVPRKYGREAVMFFKRRGIGNGTDGDLCGNV